MRWVSPRCCFDRFEFSLSPSCDAAKCFKRESFIAHPRANAAYLGAQEIGCNPKRLKGKAGEPRLIGCLQPNIQPTNPEQGSKSKGRRTYNAAKQTFRRAVQTIWGVSVAVGAHASGQRRQPATSLGCEGSRTQGIFRSDNGHLKNRPGCLSRGVRSLACVWRSVFFLLFEGLVSGFASS